LVNTVIIMTEEFRGFPNGARDRSEAEESFKGPMVASKTRIDKFMLPTSCVGG